MTRMPFFRTSAVAGGTPLWRWFPMLLLAAMLHACGGGGGGGVGGQGTGTFAYTQGPISGYGSIIVNGVDYDDTAADLRVSNEDGATLSAADLKLGMTVQIDSKGINTTTMTAVATAVKVTSEVVGPVSASDLTAGTLTVLGQTVNITASTTFDSRITGGQAGVALNSVVEVYAIHDPVSGTYAARRIEPKSTATSYVVRGALSQLDTSARTFRIGGATFVYSSGALPADVANGAILRVKVATTPDAQGRWVVGSGGRTERKPSDGSEVEIESVVSSYTSNASMVVGGLTVNASGAAITPAGSVIAAGVRVEVEGRMQNGVLVATKLEVKGGPSDSGGDDNGGGQEFELKGRITSVDTAAKTLVLRDAVVDWSGPVVYSNGTAANLVANAKVEIKGTLSADGSRVMATRIAFDN